MLRKLVKIFLIILVVFTASIKAQSYIQLTEEQKKSCGMTEFEKEKERSANELTREFVHEVEKEFGVQCIGTGGGREDAQRYKFLSVDFMAKRRATVEEAREIVVSLSERFLKKNECGEKTSVLIYSFMLVSRL